MFTHGPVLACFTIGFVTESSGIRRNPRASFAKKAGHPVLKEMLKLGSSIVKASKPFVHRLREGMVEELDHYFRILEKRLVVLTLWIFVSFLSVLFIGFGFLFVLVDIGGVSRGVACLCGGLLGFIVLFLGSHFTKESRETT
jgi:hypothetical protein